MSEDIPIPLCVDLDGTLVKLDTLHQALFLLLRREPACLLRLPGWIAKGRACLKDEVMRRVALDAAALPYHPAFLDFLRTQHAAGRTLVLATAANHRTADAVAGHLGLFSETLASTADTNLSRQEKLAAIQKRFPRFAYAGDTEADFCVWDAAAEVILVNPTAAARARYAATASHLFDDRPPAARMVLKAMRCGQWLKNLLVFAPVILAHRFLDPAVWLQALAAFFSFSCAASAIYVLNDLFDLGADQCHPRKRHRPFAAGDLPIAAGLWMIPALAAAGLALGLLLPLPFFATLLAYFALTTLYSWRLKQVAIADVLALAVLYALRIVAGSAATGIAASVWFIEFSIFLFLSLALVKRLSELRELKDNPGSDSARRERGYKVGDLPLLLAFGAASGYIAVFVFTLYLGSEKVAELYSRPRLLWIFCPLLLYWITRIWHLAWRGDIHDDPLAFASRDPQTYLVGAIGLAAILYAI